jgi:hypothetical protein
VVSNDKFVRFVILPLRGKDRFSGKRKRLKETWLVERELEKTRISNKLLNGDIRFTWV